MTLAAKEFYQFDGKSAEGMADLYDNFAEKYDAIMDHINFAEAERIP